MVRVCAHDELTDVNLRLKARALNSHSMQRFSPLSMAAKKASSSCQEAYQIKSDEVQTFGAKLQGSEKRKGGCDPELGKADTPSAVWCGQSACGRLEG